MDNPKYEHDNGSQQNSTINNGNLQLNYGTGNNDVILAVDDAELSKITSNQNKIFIQHTKGTFLKNPTNFTKRKLFILQWIFIYSSEDFLGDLLAGITIGLTVIPQSMALASIVGIPAQYGLYSSFVGTFIYLLFGTSKVVPMGPTAIVALLINNTIGTRGPAYATLLCFLTGVIQTLMSFAGLGIIVNFISVPVCSGFTSAAAILVITSQLKDLIGVKGGGGNLLKMCRTVLEHISNISIGDTIMGFACIGTVMLLKAFSTTRIGPKEEELQTAWQKNVNKLIWAIGAFRNSFVVIVCSIICYCCVHKTNHDITSDWAPPIPFKVIGKIPYGLPHFQWPEFSNSNESFLDIILFMGSGIIVIPLISLLENISLCRTFAEGKPIDTDQELLAIGMANIGNSFFQGFAGSGAIARGALNYSSGVRTPLGGLYTGLTVMAALLFLTPYFYYIPKTSLAAVIIAASFMMVDVKMVKYVYNSKKKDLVLMLITFFSCLFLPLEYGVLIGIVANVGFIMCSAAKPKISIQVQKNCDGIKYLLLTPDRYLIFPSMEYVRQTITKHGLALGIPVVIDGSSIFEADFTTANVFSMMSLDFSKKGQYLYLYNLKPSVASVFKGIKNCNIYLCANKDELNELLRNHFGPSQIQEQYQNETIWTSKM
ncbi:sodium-independent sulfate anion transporter-like isoform X1 [Aphis gossypii]|uniref:sodium-independent sulfate anion transporter-like isoform X1 n=1 Tax=Aphis gossypii TaxID=80765 RepID=UPI0021590A23|nr:sodium-independent sulfate anion transporter-like isoform X1 [Aphis gossypii]XP_027845501.2 sodium-independent sulfate anion transporter-like isoform X1 [Aphis gossypii]